MSNWTIEQIIALAPDPASAKNGKSLATPGKWGNLGTDDRAIWGECQGSGKDPYRAQIDLGEPAFKCSCPSRKFPCKHGLALFLLFAQNIDFPATTPPAWVSTWLDSRSQRAEKKQAKASEPVDPVAQAKRAASRQDKVTAGVQQLQQWLQDTIRQGLATLPTADYSLWEQPAARMVDAQAPGLARRLRELSSIPNSGEGWTDRLLVELGKLQLLAIGFDRLDTLPPPLQAEIRTQIGWTLDRTELLASSDATVMQDRWLVLGQRIELEDKLRVRRTWLWGESHNQPALILQFAHGQQPFDLNLLSNTIFEGEVAFFPSSYPLRSIVKTQGEPSKQIPALPSQPDIPAGIALYSYALAQNPWLMQFPLLLDRVSLLQDGGKWFIRDRSATILPLAQSFDPLPLLALSGGHPVTVFGEWTGEVFLPLSTWSEGVFYAL